MARYETPINTGASEITQLLQRLAEGDQAAGEQLAPLVYRELRKLAASNLRRERQGHTWQTADLVNEAYLKLAGAPNLAFNGRSHFFGIAAHTMRQLLTDYARRKRSQKRGGQFNFVPLLEAHGIPEGKGDTMADLDEALKELADIDPLAAKVVELRVYGGRTHDEIAVTVGVCTKTVNRKWLGARAWLRGKLRSNSE